MPTSAIPAVLSALVAMCTTAQATTLAGVLVLDGSPTPDRVPAGAYEGLVIGGDWDPVDRVAATSTLEPISDYAKRETIAISGAVVVKSGDPAMASPRIRAFAIVDALKVLLTVDPTLGGVAGYAADSGFGGPAEAASLAAVLTVESLRQTFSGGARCVVGFTINLAALLADS